MNRHFTVQYAVRMRHMGSSEESRSAEIIRTTLHEWKALLTAC